MSIAIFGKLKELEKRIAELEQKLEQPRTFEPRIAYTTPKKQKRN